MVDNARRNSIEFYVGEAVCSDNHARIIIVESLHHFGESIIVGVYVVGVELHAKFACFAVVSAYIPASADAEVIAFGNDMYQTFVVFELVDSLCGAVGRVVVDDDEIKLEVGFLREDATDCVAYCAHTVADGDYY